MHIVLIDVHLGEEVLVHERMVAERVLVVDADVLVQIEGHDLGKIDHALLIPLGQLLVAGDRGGAGRKTQHAVALAQNLRRKNHRRRLAGFLRGLIHLEFHIDPPES